MSYKKIEQSREARLWISGVIIPVIMATVWITTNPNVRGFVKEKVNDVKNKFKKKEKGENEKC